MKKSFASPISKRKLHCIFFGLSKTTRDINWSILLTRMAMTEGHGCTASAFICLVVHDASNGTWNIRDMDALSVLPPSAGKSPYFHVTQMDKLLPLFSVSQRRNNDGYWNGKRLLHKTYIRMEFYKIVRLFDCVRWFSRSWELERRNIFSILGISPCCMKLRPSSAYLFWDDLCA